MIKTSLDNKTRNVKLTNNEITLIIDELERQPHNIYKFLETEKLINKLKEYLK